MDGDGVHGLAMQRLRRPPAHADAVLLPDGGEHGQCVVRRLVHRRVAEDRAYPQQLDAWVVGAEQDGEDVLSERCMLVGWC